MSPSLLASGRRVLLVALVAIYSFAIAEERERHGQWTSRIRGDHPRLFFNRETFPNVRARAIGPAKQQYDKLKKQVDGLVTKWGSNPPSRPADYGYDAAKIAFVFWMTGEQRYLDAAKTAMELSLRFYEKCLAERKAVNWYGHSRTHWVMGWDWVYEQLPAPKRTELMERFVDTLAGVLSTPIYRENKSDHTTGYYGVTNCKWYAGLATTGEGIRTELVEKWLMSGYEDHQKLLGYRGGIAGDDGSSPAATVGYCFGHYPNTEFNFFYTWRSATGQSIAERWAYVALLPNYVIWNWIPGPDGRPLEFGYGDTPHTSNRLPAGMLDAHMANIRHFYGRSRPGAAALARVIQERLPAKRRGRFHWFIHPFLQDGLESSPGLADLPKLPNARHFEAAGQVFMRSGTGVEDTYAMFAAQPAFSNHQHYDALHFTIYNRGFAARDTGTRWGDLAAKANGRHLANYYAQTVAHNCVLIHMPDEPPAYHWGMPPGEKMTAPNYGGQDKKTKSKLVAFETNELFTYVAGDATSCYSPRKCRFVTRQMVFVAPNHFVIFDRVRSATPDYRKDWLIHPGSKPEFDGSTFTSRHGKGRMFCRTLLPEKPDVRIVGGPGNEFRTGEVNWAIDTKLPNGRKLSDDELRMIGQWRVEVSPSKPRKEDVFLHVIEVGSESLKRMVDIDLIQGEGKAGVRFRANGRDFEITFATRDELAGDIKISGAGAVERPLTTKVALQSRLIAK